ncbi:tetracycline efflux protein [Kwoniella heveanensis BCC8398]|uniref:Tetracycline efflux protein n=1 Tax=Kwoniella heveanensis BCC8398 TaxID=1296120 RepID=A0A1B9GJD7_9TREE|nr:tetracycline efflux protein [Kwoniella heveanensis BCC8398]
MGRSQTVTDSSPETGTAKSDSVNRQLPRNQDPGLSGSQTIARPSHSQRRSTLLPNYTTDNALSRTATSSSIHTRNALRRMATHETGEYVDAEEDGRYDGERPPRDMKLDSHDEGDNEHGQWKRSSGDPGPNDGEWPERVREPSDEEKEIEQPREGKRKEVELQDQTNLLPAKQVMLVFVGLTAALFCSLLDQTIVTTALPTLGKVFNRADISSWVGTSYLLTSTTAQPIYGRVSDIFGRKVTLLACLFIFLIGSMACALSQTMVQLIVFRAIQGLGGGGILTLSLIIISDVVSLKERGKYQGITGVVVALANSAGPILGGAITEKISWRWCFYINLPLTAASMVVVVFFLPLRRVKGSIWGKLKKLDYYGSLLTLAWASLILIALSWGGSQYAWDSAAVLAPLIIGVAILGVFLYVEAKVVSLPLVPMRIFRDPSVAACFVTSLANGMAFYATLYYLPQYFQVVRGDSAIRSGVLTLPLMLVQTATALIAGIVQSKTGDYWWNLVLGFSIWTIGLGLLSSVGATAGEAKLAVYQVLTGIGAGQTFQTSLVAIQAGVDRKDMATATGIRNFIRMLGGTISLAAGSAIINNRVKGLLKNVISEDVLDKVLSDPTDAARLGLSAEQLSAVTDAYAKGINGVFYFCTPVIGISVFITVFFVKRTKLKKSADEAAKKAEAKAWVESKKAKRRHKQGLHENNNEDSVSKSDSGDRSSARGMVDQSIAESSPGQGKLNRGRINSEDTAVESALATFTDVTAQKSVEAALKTEAENLVTGRERE